MLILYGFEPSYLYRHVLQEILRETSYEFLFMCVFNMSFHLHSIYLKENE